MKNCLTYATGKWQREGGYLVIRRSRAAARFGIKSRLHPVYWVPHFLHMSPDGVITQYVPPEAMVHEHSMSLWKFWLALWHFHGEVRTGDCDFIPELDA